ncbi:cupin domain-containing protein [Palleronia sp. THAF1]|uniref:cupin domain-containing protein n=1 Tax=Palleronia sp. THAF1 TaxID=2587842 RepID=UPI000F5318A5|nr:cupin domain-containing protein [Palleronia sp. THAF1]
MTKYETFHLLPGDDVPNNPDLPVIVVRGAFRPPGDAAKRLAANGWTGLWTWSVFDRHHFHPNAHEVLAVAKGAADLRLGGASGRDVAVGAGDALILPAGTGHCLLEGRDSFEVVGAYPPGQQDYETLWGGDLLNGVSERIARVPLPGTDPITGAADTLPTAWRA